MNKQVFEDIKKTLSSYWEKVHLLAVTKYSNIEKIQSAIENGVTKIWENRIESASQKFPHIDSSIEKHFIWKVQTKKMRKIVELFDVIQSIESIKHIERLESVCGELQKRLKVFLQFNISWEPQKSWFTESDIIDIIECSKAIKNIDIIWVMWMWSQSDLEQNRIEFKSAKRIFDTLKSDIPSMKDLSIWMSSDYKIALEEWSTLIRIWSLLFNEGGWG